MELTARHLVARGVQKIYVANRHKEKAEVLAGYFGGEAVSFEQGLPAGGGYRCGGDLHRSAPTMW